MQEAEWATCVAHCSITTCRTERKNQRWISDSLPQSEWAPFDSSSQLTFFCARSLARFLLQYSSSTPSNSITVRLSWFSCFFHSFLKNSVKAIYTYRTWLLHLAYPPQSFSIMYNLYINWLLLNRSTTRNGQRYQHRKTPHQVNKNGGWGSSLWHRAVL
jgi:hypothetical protein